MGNLAGKAFISLDMRTPDYRLGDLSSTKQCHVLGEFQLRTFPLAGKVPR